jgi:hypothetical protein
VVSADQRLVVYVPFIWEPSEISESFDSEVKVTPNV